MVLGRTYIVLYCMKVSLCIQVIQIHVRRCTHTFIQNCVVIRDPVSYWSRRVGSWYHSHWVV